MRIHRTTGITQPRDSQANVCPGVSAQGPALNRTFVAMSESYAVALLLARNSAASDSAWLRHSRIS
jgi:hypothetical protein